MSLNVSAFTAGTAVPSARFRVRQYAKDLKVLGIALHEHLPPTGSAYPPRQPTRRPFWAVKNVIGQLPAVLESRHADLVMLQRQFVSTINTLERFTGRPRLLDIDDAVWLTARFNSVDRLARRCDGIICGNSWLAEHFQTINKDVTIVPTAVDTRLYVPAANKLERPDQLIGWIGTSGNFPFLLSIEAAIERVLARFPGVQLYIVSDREPHFRHIASDRVIYEQWSVDGEVGAIQEMDVGLMPLDDSDWSRGKCSFKMLQYMACGVPAVVSPYGMNEEVLAHGGAIAAKTLADWVEAIGYLLENSGVRDQLGETARQTVVRNYSTELIAPKLAAVFRRFA